MRIRVVSLAGRRGSGKSTAALALEQHGFVRATFGGFVRTVATSRGLAHDIPTLEWLGNQLIAELGWVEFCRRVLTGKEAAARVVVDGVRHCAARDTIRRLFLPDRSAVVFFDIDETERASRLNARGRFGDLPAAGEMSDDLVQLRNEADLIVDGSSDDTLNEILDWIASSEHS